MTEFTLYAGVVRQVGTRVNGLADIIRPDPFQPIADEVIRALNDAGYVEVGITAGLGVSRESAAASDISQFFGNGRFSPVGGGSLPPFGTFARAELDPFVAVTLSGGVGVIDVSGWDCRDSTIFQ